MVKLKIIAKIVNLKHHDFELHSPMLRVGTSHFLLSLYLSSSNTVKRSLLSFYFVVPGMELCSVLL